MGSNSSKPLRQKTAEGPKRPEQRKEFPSAVTLVQPHPSEEKLFKELQQVELNYDFRGTKVPKLKKYYNRRQIFHKLKRERKKTRKRTREVI